MKARRPAQAMAALVVLALTGSGLGPSRAYAQGGDEGAETVFKKALPSTVWVCVPQARTENKVLLATGAGALIDAKRRLVVTNYHVVGDKNEAFVYFPAFSRKGELITEKEVYQKTGARIPGKVIARESKQDLALIQLAVLPKGAKALPIANKSASPGQTVHSIGNPGGTAALFVYTKGSVRSVVHQKFRAGSKEDRDEITLDCQVVLTDSPINPGDSGGPVVNNKGELVGITQGYSPSLRSVSCAIDVSELHKMLKSKGVTSLVTRPAAEAEPVETAGAKPAAPAAEDPAVKAEKDAKRLLKLAKSLAADGVTDKARERYKEIIEDYPKTKAAEEARQLLEKLK